jgi:hypothetical protein
MCPLYIKIPLTFRKDSAKIPLTFPKQKKTIKYLVVLRLITNFVIEIKKYANYGK